MNTRNQESKIKLASGRKCLISLPVLLILAFSSFSQVPSATPSPTPDPDLPAVISRDEEIENMIRERTQNADQSAQRPRTASRNAGNDVSGLDSLTEAQQKRLIFYLDLVTRLEQRAESLRSQLVSMMEKQNSVSTKIQQVDFNMRPDVIAATTGLTGSFRPEELRAQRKAELEIEKQNLEKLLSEIQTSVSTLEVNVRRADQMAERVRNAFDSVLEETLYKTGNP